MKNLLFILLQIDSTKIATTQADGLSLTDLLLKGGPIMIPILILSVFAVFLFIERYLYIRKSGASDPNFLGNVRERLLQGNVRAAIDFCSTSTFPIARLIEKGLNRMGSPIRDIEVAIENTGKVEIYKMEKNLALLAGIAAIAPMMGFLGTVMGMIKTFYDVSQAGGTINIDVIAGGIYQKMVTSAAGLIVGMLAHAFHTYLNTMIDRVINKMEVTAIDFMDILYKPVS
jgi:biopolymer transport protein ExbB